MSNAPHRPPVPGWGQSPVKKVLVGTVLVIFLIACGCLYLFLAQVFAKVGVSESSTPPRFQLGDTLDQGEWLELQQRQLLRTGLIKLDQRAEMIWEDLGTLQGEIDAYQKQFHELKVSEETKQLIEDEWVVRYFAGRTGEQLPREKVARYLRERLNELMFTAREALGEKTPPRKKAAYDISPETVQELELIEFEVSRAKEDYTRHRYLLDALAARVGDPRASVPSNLDQASQILLQRIIEQEFRGRPLDNSSQAGDRHDESSVKPPVERDSVGVDPASLQRDFRRSRAREGDDVSGTSLGRDTVRDRGEPPRSRGDK
ncbi:MAG: hypothetical protein ACYC4U_16565 [Pirellulaceae bacterium]